MSERTLELAKQAGLKKPHASDREYIGDFDWRKFAQLIIQECVQVVENVPPGYTDYRSQIEESMRNFCVVTLKKHFEIK